MPALDLRLAIPALGCWSITGVGLLCPRGVLVAVVLTMMVLSLAGALAGAMVGGVAGIGAPVVLATTGLTFGVGVALLIRADRVDAHPLRQLDGGTAAVVLRATEDPRVSTANPDVVWLRAQVHSVDDRPVPAASVIVFAPRQGGDQARWLDLGVGQPVRALVVVRVPDGRGLVVARLTARGPPAVVGAAPAYLRVSESVRVRFREVCAHTVGHREAGLLPGLVVGDTSMGEATVDEQFRRAGLTHLLAVSGANFALIVGAAVLLIGVAGGSIPLTVGAGLAATISFAVLVQLSPSVIRAAIMGGVGLLAMAASRGRSALPALAAAVVLGLLVWPELAVDLGFAMSVVATAALIVWSPPVRDRLIGLGLPRGPADAVAMATVAYVVTAPLVAAISGQVSLSAILANLAVAPAVPVATLLGAAAMLLAAPDVRALTALARVLVTACEPALRWILVVARVLGGGWAAIPTAPGWLLGIGVAVLVGRTLRRRRRVGSRRPDGGLARLEP
ncbi:ComEC/Rec2 family competence protein [Gordonia defluvii]|jgi:competence protein ComEC|uniref:ComEC/Rec2 family competence protein n=1 Tax=Gordonia defluvii TaxID=283718 RepID=A0ABP6L7H9_9ACTN|nr:ComEC/Rec2 family competence protein [Gordonia sp. UBA5067]